MKISGISKHNVSFKAKTVIVAPPSVFTKKELEHYRELGSKIGSDDDVIDIYVSGVRKSDFTPKKDVYEVRYTTRTDECLSNVKTIVRVDEMTPKKFLDSLFECLNPKKKKSKKSLPCKNMPV